MIIKNNQDQSDSSKFFGEYFTQLIAPVYLTLWINQESNSYGHHIKRALERLEPLHSIASGISLGLERSGNENDEKILRESPEILKSIARTFRDSIIIRCVR